MEETTLTPSTTTPASLSVEQPVQPVEQRNPQLEIAFAKRAADALMSVIAQKPKKIMINGEQYLEFGDWQTIARFYALTVTVVWTKPLAVGDKFAGYEARAAVLSHDGRELSAAEASCTIQERNWKNRDRFQLKSMAQTRACAKAYRNVLGWVVELAGFKATPAEELDVQTNDVATATRIKSDDQPVEKKSSAPAGALVEIFKLLQFLGHARPTAEENHAKVEALTGLPYRPENYQDIAIRMRQLYQEHLQAAKSEREADLRAQ